MLIAGVDDVGSSSNEDKMSLPNVFGWAWVDSVQKWGLRDEMEDETRHN